MSRDEVYRLLMAPHWKGLEIARKEKVIAEIKSCLLPGAIRYDKDRVQTSPSDQMSEVMARVDEMERQVEVLKAERSSLIIKVSDTLEKLSDDTEKTVLSEWYINRTRPEEISRIIGYSSRHMYRYKKEGIQHLCDILKDVSKCQ